LPKGTKTAYQATKNGYTVECAIPLVAISKKQGQEWQYLRTNVMVDDYDRLGAVNTRYSQYPDWWSEDSYVGSGLRFR
jgi:hypothetical protein